VPARPARTALVLAYGVTIRDKGHREHASGQADLYDEPRARVVSWPPLRPTRLRRERGSVVVVSPTDSVEAQQRGAGDGTRDRHGHPPHFCGGGFLGGGRLRPAGRLDMTRSGLEGFGRSSSKEDEVVVEATGNAMAPARSARCSCRLASRRETAISVARPMPTTSRNYAIGNRCRASR